MIRQGDVCWLELPPSDDPSPGYRRPAVVVQGDEFNRSRIATVVCVILTSNLNRGEAPGNVVLRSEETSLPKDSVANVSQIVTLDRGRLSQPVGKLSYGRLHSVLRGSDRVLGRQ